MSFFLFRSPVGREFTLLALNRVANVQLTRGYNKRWRDIIGNREVVGHGINGLPIYFDQLNIPFPAIRFRKDTSDVLQLKEKEKGDWHQLTKEEKKTLYRHSYCRTFAELMAPSGEWKLFLAGVLWITSLATICMLLEKIYVFPPLPESFLPENQRNALKAHLANHTDEIQGISSKWDYEKNCWKK